MEHKYRQRYCDLAWGDLEAVAHYGYDVCQPKYDGEWCVVVTGPHRLSIVSRTGRTMDTARLGRSMVDAALVGEYLSSKRTTGYRGLRTVRGKPTIIVWDCMRLGTLSLRDVPYAQRLAAAREIVETMDEKWIRIVEPAVYDMACTGEGFIFRRSTDDFDGEIARMKRPGYRPFD